MWKLYCENGQFIKFSKMQLFITFFAAAPESTASTSTLNIVFHKYTTIDGGGKF